MRVLLSISLAGWALAQPSVMIPITQPDMRVHLLSYYFAPDNLTRLTINSRESSWSVDLRNNWTLLADHANQTVQTGFQLISNRDMGVVVEYIGPDGDLNLVGMPLLYSYLNGFVIYHMGANPTWENRIHVASQSDLDLDVMLGNGQTAQFFCPALMAEIYGFEGLNVQRGQGWALIQDARHIPIFAGSFFDFTRMDGIRGSAAVRPYHAVDSHGTPQPSYITHIAKDTQHFWTGYSILNANDQKATVGLTAYGGGQMIGYEEFEIGPWEQDIAVIGQERLATHSPADMDWIRVDSDRLLLGCELFGSPNQVNTYLSGFELPWESRASTHLLFPATAPGTEHWTGICVLNPAHVETNLTIYAISDQADDPVTTVDEAVIFTTFRTLPPYQKWVETLASMMNDPVLLDRTRAVCVISDNPVFGFALVGDAERHQLGGYLAL